MIDSPTRNTVPDFILAAVLKRKRLFFSVAVMGVLLSLVVVLVFPRKYVAQTTILPPQSNNTGTLAAIAQIGALAGLPSNIKQQDDLYAALLLSNSVLDSVIAKNKLRQRYETETLDETRKKLAGRTGVSIDKKSSLITITYADSQADEARNVVNGYFSALSEIAARLALTEAKQRRMLLEREASRLTRDLKSSESKFLLSQSEGGMVTTAGQAEFSARHAIALQTSISLKEAELDSVAKFATPASASYKKISADLQALKGQLRSLQEGNKAALIHPNASATETAAALRDVQLYSGALEVMLKQLEIAKVDEAQQGPLIQQIDIAQPPERPSKPTTGGILLVGLTLTLIASIGIPVALEMFRRTIPHQGAQ